MAGETSRHWIGADSSNENQCGHCGIVRENCVEAFELIGAPVRNGYFVTYMCSDCIVLAKAYHATGGRWKLRLELTHKHNLEAWG